MAKAKKLGAAGKNARIISMFALALINVAAIASLRGLPSMAEYGLSSVFFYCLAALTFFIPAALVSAELATGWPKEGGVYAWVKEAFGENFGFLAIWIQWIQNVIWYPTALSFTAATLAFAFNPALASNSIFMFAIILIVYWGATLLNLRGMALSSKITSLGAMGGTIIPGTLIIILAIAWLLGPNPVQTEISFGALFPDMESISSIVLAVSVLLSFAGIEMSAVHAREVKNPKKDFPRAIFLSVAIILVVFILGTLAISIVVPAKSISLVAGVMQSFSIFLKAYNLAWLIPIISLMIAGGAIGQVSTWIAGPSRGMLTTAKGGCLPKFLSKTNSAGMPINMLIIQGAIVTILATVFLFMPDVSSSYWILTALTAIVYLVMYVIMFSAAIKLRYSSPKVKRAYCVPGGKLGMWAVAGLGIASSLIGIAVGFFPPAQEKIGNFLFYEGFLICGAILLVGAPLLIHYAMKGKNRGR
ncbi:amino acid permease [Candidatus Micrarchaeota archaeon CG10_big_fil_rev_8_21_14_0_10_45_29]|nr:MAG: amino acid permease [Candidatus Micrarchaeota archaeon CG10_big_fil_rev_8_21_14_0_10_45_29]